jgi:hypothetical protein
MRRGARRTLSGDLSVSSSRSWIRNLTRFPRVAATPGGECGTCVALRLRLPLGAKASVT